MALVAVVDIRFGSDSFSRSFLQIFFIVSVEIFIAVCTGVREWPPNECIQ